MPVCRTFDFLIDFHHAVYYGLPFLLREVQCFIDGIGKERVILHVTAEGRTVQQFGLEGEPPTFGLEGLSCIVIADDLPRCGEYQRFFLKIVEFAAILYQVGTLDVFQINDIETDVLADMVQGPYPGRIDYAYQRMGRLYTQKVIVISNRIQLYNLIHNSSFHCYHTNV